MLPEHGEGLELERKGLLANLFLFLKKGGLRTSREAEGPFPEGRGNMCMYVCVLRDAPFLGFKCHLCYSEPPELRVCTTITSGAPSLAMFVPLCWVWAGTMTEGSFGLP